MSELVIRPARPRGRLRPPPDKSISHRAALLGAIASGTTRARRFLVAADTLSTVHCLRALGVEAELQGDTLTVRGRGIRGFRPPEGVLDVGNSGTTIRLLCGLLAQHAFEATLDGDDSIRRRPMDRVIQPLREMGAWFEARMDRFVPLRVRGGALRPIRYSLPVASAQVKSAILLAGLAAEGKTTVIEPQASRDHTERLLGAMGVPVEEDGQGVSVVGPAQPRAVELAVPGDLSSAAFFLVAAAARPGSELVVEDVGLNPTRTGILEVLRAMGAHLGITDLREEGGEPVGTVVVRGGELQGVEIRGEIIPRLIDEIPALAVAAAVAEGETVIRDAAELRVKESDRIRALVSNLRAVGVHAEELPDGLRIRGSRIRGGVVDSFGDHRIAMAFAVAGLLSEEGVVVRDTACIATSFPEFGRVLRSLCGR
ncbi:MAG: 3-phosphoshikimate 1-carboxyvinyltransferase [Armatimonadota bacterium]|nr:3-phosphoshikimate 1-carboxyvinyltransferase [Armatimonadota bacterium]MDR7444394.1 3-phosphoshikimate 1-carboxyvinyltransferase [Armatimonadota bacterium]MDR7570750.1 3-phosphoshikimate 1-carboxyvinyltransferase [Armatimonadota bacterium]MDR7614880.1 3-phosphoshikimate 1-carboxyvinyltransferase [Armatimonadota bacterium]